MKVLLTGRKFAMGFASLRTFSSFAILLSFMLFPLHHAEGGAWLQPKGGLFASFITYYYSTTHYFDSHGSIKKRGGRFTKFEINPYFEYGVSDKDTAVLNIFYDWIDDERRNGTVSNDGFTDLELGWRRKVWSNDWNVVSSQFTLVVPLGYDIEDDPRLGYGRYALEFALQYGHAFLLADRYGFIDLYVGPRFYIGYPSDQFRIKLTAGYDITQKTQILAFGELHYGLGNGSLKRVGRNLTVTPDYKLLKVGLSGRYRITPHLSLVFTGYSHIWGEDTGAGGGFYGSIWLSY